MILMSEPAHNLSVGSDVWMREWQVKLHKWEGSVGLEPFDLEQKLVVDKTIENFPVCRTGGNDRETCLLEASSLSSWVPM